MIIGILKGIPMIFNLFLIVFPLFSKKGWI